MPIKETLLHVLDLHDYFTRASRMRSTRKQVYRKRARLTSPPAIWVSATQVVYKRFDTLCGQRETAAVRFVQAQQNHEEYILETGGAIIATGLL